ncbi:hypothetical protein [Methylomonas sp. DH-1]|uniref:hypothetical protein n=1 Tax=Methylomonas sp. (strain DH-1) TaxID=1727196 RepID=UPI0007C8ABAB|nr:hypothetical protein [Methylomonas sp. DH-1]ANE55321.1 hypothetical protein AYM39_09130 [Methylomonas sp. DH-1]
MSNKTTRISADDLSAFAEQGKQRALQARAEAGSELSAAELELVSGGASASLVLSKGIIAGGPWFDQFKAVNGLATNPAAGGLAAGIQGATLQG